MPFDGTVFAEADVFVCPARDGRGGLLGYRVQTVGGGVIAVVRHRDIAIAIARAVHDEERRHHPLH